MKQPIVYIIAGPNGAGKTTFAENFLPDFVHCREFLNADLIAAGLSPFAPETQDMRAARLLLTRVKELIAENKTFAVETTLAGRSYVRLLKQMKSKGYRVVLFFLWLPSVDMAISRVRSRVQQGGHNIPTDVIKRRYKGGLKNLFQLYRPLSDVISIYNASWFSPELVMYEVNDNMTIYNEKTYKLISLE